MPDSPGADADRAYPFHWDKLKERAPKLLLSGLLLGLDWVFFFEAFNHTTVAIATLCYYMAPVFMLAAAPLVFHETIRRRKLVCAAITIGGMLLVSGVLGSDGNIGDITGVLCALAGAFFYAAIIVLSKTIQGPGPYEQTAVQAGNWRPFPAGVLAFSPADGFPGHDRHRLGADPVAGSGPHRAGLWDLFRQPDPGAAQTTAILSYVDPVVAVCISVFVLQEPITELQLAGICLVLGGMISGERK